MPDKSAPLRLAISRSETTEQFPPGYVESQLPRVPAGRPSEPEELAAAVVFVASPAAGCITGTTLVVDGG
jgi:NAD(P)-dependent dehydrogenase (short-subunit alcohol dehydrogenase family)